MSEWEQFGSGTDSQRSKPVPSAGKRPIVRASAPLDLQGRITTATNAEIYAFGTVIWAVASTAIALALGTIHVLNKRHAAKGSDAGKRMV